jgi:endonuclease YncB( thermonuclease family)
MITFESKLGWGLLIAGLVLMLVSFCQPVRAASEYREYKQTLLAVVDCDTVELQNPDVTTDIQPGVSNPYRLRIKGVNCPESKVSASKCPTEKGKKTEAKRGLIAKADIKKELPPTGSTVTLRWRIVTPKDKNQRKRGEMEKFGRHLGFLIYGEGKNLSEWLVSTGHAEPYFGEKKSEVFCK